MLPAGLPIRSIFDTDHVRLMDMPDDALPDRVDRLRRRPDHLDEPQLTAFRR